MSAELSRAAARYYPAMLDLRGRKVVVIGGGRIGLHKVKELEACAARIDLIEPRPSAAALALAASKSVHLRQRGYRKGDLAGAILAVVATKDAVVQTAAWNEAQTLGIFVNTVDQVDRCSFIAPSLLRRGSLTVAVSTNGKNPALARRIREGLEAHFSAGFGAFLDLATRARARLRSAGISYADRDSFAGELMSSEAPALMAAGNAAQAEGIVSDLLARYGVQAP